MFYFFLFVSSIVYTSTWPKFSLMAFGFGGQIHVTLNLDLIFFCHNDWSNFLSTHLANVTLCAIVSYHGYILKYTSLNPKP
jgi:uncharacterized membrane protein